MVNIELFTIEPHKAEVNNKVIPAAKQLMEFKGNLDIISDGLTSINRFNNWKETFNDWKNANSTAPLEIFNIIEYLFNQIKNESIFNDVRGAILEKIVEFSVSSRFNNPNCRKKSGCSVKINNKTIPIDQTITKKAFDYAVFDPSTLNAEFYECKAHPNKFEEDNIRLFQNLKSTLNSTDINSYILGCVSYHNKRSILREFKKNNFDISNLTIIGKDELKSL